MKLQSTQTLLSDAIHEWSDNFVFDIGETSSAVAQSLDLGFSVTLIAKFGTVEVAPGAVQELVDKLNEFFTGSIDGAFAHLCP